MVYLELIKSVYLKYIFQLMNINYHIKMTKIKFPLNANKISNMINKAIAFAKKDIKKIHLIRVKLSHSARVLNTLLTEDA